MHRPKRAPSRPYRRVRASRYRAAARWFRLVRRQTQSLRSLARIVAVLMFGSLRKRAVLQSARATTQREDRCARPFRSATPFVVADIAAELAQTNMLTNKLAR